MCQPRWVSAWSAQPFPSGSLKKTKLPHGNKELIDGVGHFMMVEQPSEINARVTNWLKRTA